MEKAEDPLAAALAGHKRSSVLQRSPGLVRERRVGFGQHLSVDDDVPGHGEPGKGAVGGERRQVLWLFPGHAPAEGTIAPAELDRNQIVLVLIRLLRKPGTGKTHQHPALVDPIVEPFAELRRERADVGQDDHWHLLVEELRDRLLRRHASLGQAYIGERRKCPAQVEGGSEQRLCGFAGRATDDADRAAPPALVEQLHRARRSLAGDFEPSDIVTQFDRKIERRFRLRRPGRKGESRLADRRTLGIERAHEPADRRTRVGAQHLDRHPGRGILGSRQRERRRCAALIDRQCAIAGGFAQGREELLSTTGVDAVREPCDIDITGCLQEAIDRAQGFCPVDGIGLWRKLAQGHARGPGRHQSDVARGLRQRGKRDAAPIGIGVGNQFIGRSDPRVPTRGRTPPVIQQDQERRLASGKAVMRIPYRSGGRKDHQRGGGEPQRSEPPRRARRRLFPGRNVEQQPGRRKLQPPRPWRRHPEHPPQYRQA